MYCENTIENVVLDVLYKCSVTDTTNWSAEMKTKTVFISIDARIV